MSLAPDQRTMLADSYPDDAFLQTLSLCDIWHDTRRDIAAFYAPPSFRGEVRCDLHPRFDTVAGKVTVDHANQGKRALSILTLN